MVDYACGTNLKERMSSFREIEYQKERLLLRIHEKCKLSVFNRKYFLYQRFPATDVQGCLVSVVCVKNAR